jgi:Domain of unknown function (DUF222)/HNH endonuclease
MYDCYMEDRTLPGQGFHDIADEIEASVNEIAGYLNAQHALLVDHVVTLLADTRLWQGPGVWTMRQWLAWRAGLSPATARRVVTVAERVGELPECAERFRRGELSLDQMAAIAGRAPSWTDRQMSGLGASMTVRQIQRTLARYPFPSDETTDATDAPDDSAASDRAVDDPAAHDHAANDDASIGSDSGDSSSAVHSTSVGRGGSGSARDDAEFCSVQWGDDGMFRLGVRCDDDHGKVIEAALCEARDRLFQAGRRDVGWLDALREVAERSLDSVADRSRRDRFKVSLFVDADATTTDTGHNRVTDALRARLLCDGALTPIFLDDGRPVSVGRSQRIVPERTRRIVEQRDRATCRVPGCDAHHFLEVHHIVHWLDGGVTDTFNLICLCPHHHRLHHRGRLGISGNADAPDGVVFTNAHGRPIAQTGAEPIPPSGPPPPPIGTYRHPSGERLDTRWLEFHRSPPAASTSRAAS